MLSLRRTEQINNQHGYIISTVTYVELWYPPDMRAADREHNFAKVWEHLFGKNPSTVGIAIRG